MSLMLRLKAETSTAHDRIEGEVALAERLASLDGYRRLVARFHGFHRVFEPELDLALAGDGFLAPRRKIGLLERDLAALGLTAAEIAALPRCRPLPAPLTRAAALGALYVVEGSTLGGALIARDVERVLGLTPETGCAYFRAYGRETAAMWRAFCQHVDASGEPADDVVAGAIATFERLRAWLADDVAAPAKAAA